MTNEELCLLIQHGSDKKSYMEQLYLQNRGLIAKIAKKYCAYGEMEDLLQEGYFGLVKAANSWNEEKDARFSTYASYHIRAYMQRYIENNGTAVRLPTNLRIHIMKLKRITDDYLKTIGRKPTIREISLRMQLSEKQINRIIEDALFLEIRSTNEILSSEDDSISLEDTIEDNRDMISQVDAAIQNEQLKVILWEIVDSLDSDQARVIHEKFQNNANSIETAAIMGTTPNVIKTLENRAFRELRKHKNTKRLESFFMSDSRIYSISSNHISLSSFNRTWTSSTERAVLLAES